MKNFEKYKTPEEAFKAQVRFCQEQSKDEVHCHKNGCKYSTGTTPCLLQWLYDEFRNVRIVKWTATPIYQDGSKGQKVETEIEVEEDEELLPCPFCGGEAKLNSSVESWVECSVCHIRTEMSACDSGAIEKWNRRTK